MARCLISFGANIGDSLETIQQAAGMLRDRLSAGTDAFRLSRMFRTPPVGGPAGQPPFINAVAAVRCSHSAMEVWQMIREVEQQLGRERFRRWEARRIDLDILLYDDLRIWSPQLKIPHPRMCMRRFILVPAMDVAAEWIDPVSQMSIRNLANALQTNAASLALVDSGMPEAESWLQQVAKLAMARVVDLNEHAEHATNSIEAGRWVTLIPGPQLGIPLQAQPRLTVFLAQSSRHGRIAWEQQHQELAVGLGLAATDDDSRRLQISGPRYLLAADDSQWAVHEMVAALEAMDCPVEAL
jgi:2-amino-4-hydroxy-6-hydroxymethyldihydropteridine diphosphokinase